MSTLAGWTSGPFTRRRFDPPWREADLAAPEWVSYDIPLPGATGLVLSWNCRSGVDPCRIRFEVSVRIRGAWSPWTGIGAWGPVHERPPASDGPINISIDTASWDGEADAARVRVTNKEPSKRESGLRRVILAVDSAAATDPSPPAPPSSDPFVASVPFMSQLDQDASIARRICGATSLAMVLPSLGCGSPTPAEIARRAYDPTHDIYGNWAYLTAAASEYGAVAWAEWLTSLRAAEERIAEGYGVVLSVAYEEGELPGSPLDRTSGHLVVLRGWTADGDPVLNDPAFPDRAGDGVVYPRAVFERLWLGHGGATLVLRPE